LLLLNFGLVNQHDRDVITYRVDPVALNALEAAPIFFEDDLPFAKRANKNFQQFFADRHGNLQFISGGVCCE
jgi:hypothetical protein